jgi:hypothetical protein
MDWQIATVMLIALAATLYLARSIWRAWSGAGRGCGGSCGCTKAPSDPVAGTTLIPADQITLRRRGGIRP